MEKAEKNILIARRVPPSDRWRLVDDEIDGKIYTSLTETLEAYYQRVTVKPQVFRLEPLKGELFVVTTEEVIPSPPKRFNIYGDY